MADRSTKKRRHREILELIRTRRIHSQDELGRTLAERGFEVTQTTLSRDLKELRVAKVPHAEGESYYAAASEGDGIAPALERLLPHLLLSADGVGNLVVVKTAAGGAQAVAEAIDLEGWPEILGSLAGDDTILLVIREPRHLDSLIRRIERLAGR